MLVNFWADSLQSDYTTSKGEDIYDVLLAEFGDAAADTIVSLH